MVKTSYNRGNDRHSERFYESVTTETFVGFEDRRLLERESEWGTIMIYHRNVNPYGRWTRIYNYIFSKHDRPVKGHFAQLSTISRYFPNFQSQTHTAQGHFCKRANNTFVQGAEFSGADSKNWVIFNRRRTGWLIFSSRVRWRQGYSEYSYRSSNRFFSLLPKLHQLLVHRVQRTES